MPTITETRARRLGWELSRGSYTGTSDNRVDRWYWERIDSDVIDRTGPGYATKKDALLAFGQIIEDATLDTTGAR